MFSKIHGSVSCVCPSVSCVGVTGFPIDQLCWCCRFAKAKALGRSILEKNPNAQDVRDKLKRLEEEEQAVENLWKQRQKQLQDAYNLQVCLSAQCARARARACVRACVCMCTD